ncbi:MAG: flippase [Thermoplasmatales archaeon]|nr:flippase [Thermoplasmatales archaeon]
MIARKSFLIVASSFFTRFIGWIGLVVLVKIWGDFGPEALGTIGFAMSFVALFNVIADLGFSQAHVKRISEGKDLGTCIGTYAAIKLLLTGLMATIVFAALFIWKNVFDKNFSDATTESVIVVFIIYYVFVNILQIALVTFAGRKEIAKRQIPQLFEGVKTPLVILVALAGVNIAGIAPAVSWPEFLQPLQQFLADHAVGSLAMTYVFSIMAEFFVAFWFLRKYPIKRPDWNLFKNYLSYAMPIMLFSVVGIISLNVDKIMIGFFWTNTEVGYYFTFQMILGIMSILYLAVGTVLFPTISEYHSFNNIPKIKELTHIAERYISMVVIPPLIVVIVFVYPVINIMLDSAFLPAASVLLVMMVYIFIFSVNRPYGTLIRGMNRPDITVKIGLAICISNIVLNFLFIPKDGLLSFAGINGPTGAAIATTISTLVSFFGVRIAARRLSGIKLFQTHTIRHIIAGLVMGGVLYYLGYQIALFPVINWYHLLMFAGLGLVIYISVLFILREFNKDDLKFFLDMLRPKEMLKYISSELKDDPKK